VVVEKLLQLLITEVDANLLEAIVVKDFKTSNIEDTNEMGSLETGFQSFVTFFSQAT